MWSLDRDAAAEATFSADHLPAETSSHACSKSELASPLDLADAAGVMHGHGTELRRWTRGNE